MCKGPWWGLNPRKGQRKQMRTLSGKDAGGGGGDSGVRDPHLLCQDFKVGKETTHLHQADGTL